MVILGRGNVAVHLSDALSDAGFDVVTLGHGDIDSVIAGERPLPEADTYVISVTDTALADVVAGIPDNGALWLHTAGSVGMEVFHGKRSRYGVLYPLQTFTADKPVDMSAVPWLIEGASDSDLEATRRLALSISPRVYPTDSATRAKVHLAAVFAANFACRMLAEAERVLDGTSLPLELLRPLVEEVVSKAFAIGPAASLTGPARRGDMPVIHKQLSALPGHSAEIYRVVTAAILHDYHSSIPLS